MDQNNKTFSFIPKHRKFENLDTPIRHTHLNLLAIIATIMFVTSVFSGLGVFLYKGYLIRSINAINEKLLEVKNSFEPNFIEELISFDQRIEISKNLFAKHNTLSSIFSILEKDTLENVRFSSLNYSNMEGANPSLVISGEAISFDAIALQSDVFGKNDLINDPVFKNFDVNKDGFVEFNFSGSLQAEPFLYRNVFKELISGSSSSELTIPENIIIDESFNPNTTPLNNIEFDELFNDLPEF